MSSAACTRESAANTGSKQSGTSFCALRSLIAGVVIPATSVFFCFGFRLNGMIWLFIVLWLLLLVLVVGIKTNTVKTVFPVN